MMLPSLEFYVVTLQEFNKVRWHHATELSKWVDSEEQFELIDNDKAYTGTHLQAL